MRKVCVIGVAMTRFGKYPESWVEEFGRDACKEAIIDAGVRREAIQVAYCSHSFQGRVTGQRPNEPLWPVHNSSLQLYRGNDLCNRSRRGLLLSIIECPVWIGSPVLASRSNSTVACQSEKTEGGLFATSS